MVTKDTPCPETAKLRPGLETKGRAVGADCHRAGDLFSGGGRVSKFVHSLESRGAERQGETEPSPQLPTARSEPGCSQKPGATLLVPHAVLAATLVPGAIIGCFPEAGSKNKTRRSSQGLNLCSLWNARITSSGVLIRGAATPAPGVCFNHTCSTSQRCTLRAVEAVPVETLPQPL